jgi:transcriptional antiterminator NusG
MEAEIQNIQAVQYYVFRVFTGKEKKYLEYASRLLKDFSGKLIWPRRSLEIKKKGIAAEKISSLYPGYLIWETTDKSYKHASQLRKIPLFLKFLRNNNDILPLISREREVFRQLILYGEIIGKSNVYFDDENRIKVLSGPLKLLEGDIVKVDKRKKRAKVKLSLHGKSILVDLAFEVMENLSFIAV